MSVPDLPPDRLAVAQIVLAVILGTAGFTLLLPRPRGRSIALGMTLALAGLVVGTLFLATTFGTPTRDYVGPALFWLFGGAALFFGGLLVAQANPARGAMAFAFVILSTCGLFLLLAAPFLMAATVVIYMGAIVVTFLFVLMLSNAKGPSDENDRSREPFLGSLAGFAFAGLVLFALYTGSPVGHATGPGYLLPVVGVTGDDSHLLIEAAADLQSAADSSDPAGTEQLVKSARERLLLVVGAAPGELIGGGAASAFVPHESIQERLGVASADARVAALIAQADDLRDAKKRAVDAVENMQLGGGDSAGTRSALLAAREQSLLLAGRGELPARNVSAIGLSLYSEHLIAVELAGTLLLVATVGAVAIANRRGAAA